jgi:subtilisin family serine protease
MGQIAGLEDAWTVTRGAGAVLAVVDEGVDVQDHPEFAGRVLPGYNQRNERDSELLRAWRPHGTKVAGLALAGGQGVTGIAPDALLLPVPVPALARRIGDRTEAEGIRWAANHGADVICCAWAPPAHSPESGSLPRHTREALDYCLTYGRDGKGCIVVFSAGNDRSDIALNGYASHPGVIAVGACNCHGKHPSYSNWGEALWCVFPSNDPLDPVGAGMSYVTTAPAGSFLQGDAFYSSSFGFTSAACAAVAGVCALVVSANPHLTAWEVKDLLRGACEQIDAEGGTYDERGHSPLYGYGRPDIARAVNLARQPEKR